MLQQTNYLMRTLVYGGIVSLLGFGGWEARQYLHQEQAKLEEKDRDIQTLKGQLATTTEEMENLRQVHQLEMKSLQAEHQKQMARLEQELARINTALKFLKLEHRLARLEVLDQRRAEGDPEKILTTLKFTELDAVGQPHGQPTQGVVEGRELYLDAPLIQFKDEFIEQGDLLRGRTICRFRRVFGDQQAPRDGLNLDHPPQSPSELSPFEQELWNQFWQLANHPAVAEQKGVRAAHGGGPSIVAKKGAVYHIDLRASGGLTIRPVETSVASQPADKSAKP